MPSKILSAAIVGLDAELIEVEADISRGLPRFNIVGLPDKAVEESKERVESAIKALGFKSPFQANYRVLINLAPADLKKEGCLYDLPIALAYLLESGQLRFEPKNMLFLGELALDGRLRPIKGAISFALLAKKKELSYLVLPKENASEAGLIAKESQKLKIIAAQTLRQIVDYLNGGWGLTPFELDKTQEPSQPCYPLDLGWIKGQEHAKRALEIAAAGNHNLLFSGPPGTGKTLLAQAMPSILPELSFEESVEVTKIYSVAGLLPKDRTLITSRPFRSPHHTTSEVALIGGGNPPRPGEITLAHRGVLFLDEWPEFHRDVLEDLRQPIEEGSITILRSKHHLRLPAKFMLIAATNPCPCGYKNDAQKTCTCTASQLGKYQRKLAGPLMDRLDLFVDVPKLESEKLLSPETADLSRCIRERVKKARRIQNERFSSQNAVRSEVSNDDNNILTNSEMTLPQIKKHCQVDSHSQTFLRKAVDSGQLSARGYHRVLKTARTIADLDEAENIQLGHLSEALSYREFKG